MRSFTTLSTPQVMGACTSNERMTADPISSTYLRPDVAVEFGRVAAQLWSSMSMSPSSLLPVIFHVEFCRI